MSDLANEKTGQHTPDIVDALMRVIEAGERSLGSHTAPYDCYATGPLTGNPIADLVACPGCALQEEIKHARAAIRKAEAL